MTDKAYIVSNKEQELDMLNKFEQKGLVWRSGRRAVNFVPSERTSFPFPYAFIENGVITWSPMEELKDKKIVYDGRKGDEEVDTRYKVTQDFIDALSKWRDVKEINANFDNDITYIVGSDLDDVPALVRYWWIKSPFTSVENNERLIAIIKWLNGEDVFEVEKPHKFVVRSENTDVNGDYNYVKVVFKNLALVTDYDRAMQFDTREEAQEWANSHQVVVEIDAEGNEVE